MGILDDYIVMKSDRVERISSNVEMRVGSREIYEIWSYLMNQ